MTDDSGLKGPAPAPEDEASDDDLETTAVGLPPTSDMSDDPFMYDDTVIAGGAADSAAGAAIAKALGHDTDPASEPHEDTAITLEPSGPTEEVPPDDPTSPGLPPLSDPSAETVITLNPTITPPPPATPEVEWTPKAPAEDTEPQESLDDPMDASLLTTPNVEAAGVVREPREATVQLDLEQHDKLMRLRAQQDQLLKTRFEQHVVIMFTDVVGSTAYYEKFGDLMGRQKMLTHNAMLFPIVRASSGTIVKTIGDSIMACFDDPDEALSAAAEIQRALAEFNHGCSEADDEIHVRIGLNAGPAIAEGGDLHGDAVNVAARVEAWAKTDEILVADSVADSVTQWTLDPVGPVAMKGKREPIRLFRLQWQDETQGRAVDGRARSSPAGLPERYRVREVVGRGAVGVVYSAEDAEWDDQVVVKVLHRHVSEQPGAQQTFDRIMKIAEGLRHENIVSIRDHGITQNGDLFYVAEHVDGIDLAQLVARHGRPPVHELAWLGYRVGAAADFAHKHGLVHSDLKPENVLIDDKGEVKVADFGLTEIWVTDLTETASPISSPAFIASEVLTGGDWDERADVYSLGALLYYLACGKPPVERGASVQALRAIALGRIQPLMQVDPNLPSDLIAVVDKAVSLSPATRFDSMASMMTRMRQLVDKPGTVQVESLSRYVDPSGSANSNTQTRIVANAQKLMTRAGITRQRLPLFALGVGAAVVSVLLLSVLFGRSDPDAVQTSTVVTATPPVAGTTVPAAPSTDVIEATHVASPGPNAPTAAELAAAPVARPADPTPVVASPSERGVRAKSPTANRSRKSRRRDATATGTVIVTSFPFADVYIGGKKVGTTPEVKLTLPVGTHRLRLVNRPARISQDVTVKVTAGGSIKRHVQLRGRK